MAEVRPIDKPTQMPPVDSGLLGDGLTESQPKSLPSLPPKQQEPVDLGLTGSAASDITSNESLAHQH